MAHIQRRKWVTESGQSRAAWRARYVDPDGRERSKSFSRKVDAERWLAEQQARIGRGEWVDPQAGQVTLKRYVDDWLQLQIWRPSTEAQVRSYLTNHVLPVFGARPIASIRPSHVQAFVKEASLTLAPATVRLIHGYLSSILRSAVADRLISSNPCESTVLPKLERGQIRPPTTDEVLLLIEVAPEPFRALIVLLAGCGLRLSEALGLTLDRIDFLRKEITVDRQLVAGRDGSLSFGPPKTQASNRVVPLPDVVGFEIAEHVRRSQIAGEGFLFTDADGDPVRRNRFSEKVWRPTLKAAGISGLRTHDLRHYYASALIAHGASVKAVQTAMGHASASETLDTYGHLWPSDDQKIREAVDGLLGSTGSGQETAMGS